MRKRIQTDVNEIVPAAPKSGTRRIMARCFREMEVSQDGKGKEAIEPRP
jgi:hypothetical protein